MDRRDPSPTARTGPRRDRDADRHTDADCHTHPDRHAHPTLTATPTVSITPTPTVTFTPAPGQFLLTVTKLGAGTGTVTFDPLGVDCGTTCAVSVAPGTTITLQARTANGADSFFQGYGGGACAGSARDCVIQVNADTHVDATFAAQDFNLVFVTSATFASDLGGTSAYDVSCNDAASAAGINDSDANGTRFVAWLSDASSTAATRIGAARGFVRLDGKPVADTMASLLTGGILNPIRIDENGTEVRRPSSYDRHSPERRRGDRRDVQRLVLEQRIGARRTSPARARTRGRPSPTPHAHRRGSIAS